MNAVHVAAALGYEISADRAAYLDRLVAQAPPLTEEQRTRIAIALRTGRQRAEAAA